MSNFCGFGGQFGWHFFPILCPQLCRCFYHWVLWLFHIFKWLEIVFHFRFLDLLLLSLISAICFGLRTRFTHGYFSEKAKSFRKESKLLKWNEFLYLKLPKFFKKCCSVKEIEGMEFVWKHHQYFQISRLEIHESSMARSSLQRSQKRN